MNKVCKAIAKYQIWALLVAVVVSIAFIVMCHNDHMGDENEYYFDDGNVQEWTQDWEIHFGNSNVDGVDLPADLPVQRGESIIMRNVLPDKIKNYNCIMLEGNRQDIEVSINGIRRATFSNKTHRLWGKTSPSGIVIVPLYNTDSRADVAIRIASDSLFSGVIGKVYLGNEKSLLLMILRENVPAFLISAIVFILGVVCAVSFYSYTTNFEISKALGHLAIFALLVSMWSFSQSPLRQFFFEDLALLEDIGYCAYMLIPLATVIYANRISNNKHKKFADFFSFLVIANFVLENIFQFAFGWGFYEMRYVSQTLMLLGIAVISHICAMEHEKKNAVLVQYLTVGTIGLIVSLLTEIASQNFYFIEKQDTISNTIYIIGAAVFLASGFLYTLRCVSEEQKLKKDAESANRAKTNFLANISHEIKTPINAMLGMNEMIMREATEDSVLEYAANIGDAGKSLLSLVNDILDYSKIESGKMEIISSNYKMKNILKDLIAMTNSRINSSEVKLILDIEENLPSVFFGDGIRIKQVLSNLLSNAVKYTEKGTITFCVTGQGIKDDDIELFFSVKDTGIGIPAENIEKIMESFARAEEERNSKVAGSGLGLTITKQLLELMESKLEVDSTPGEGSEFSFVLKQRIVDTAPLGTFDQKVGKTSTRHKITFTAPEAKILAVDDVAMNLKVLKHLLEPAKVKLDICGSGQECLELCKDTDYDLIIMDHMMPEMDGIEAFHSIRSDKTLASTDSTVIVLTANTVSGAEEMYLTAGFDYYMKKPVDVSELNDVILRFLPPEKIKPLVVE